jgi:hypothetical protein
MLATLVAAVAVLAAIATAQAGFVQSGKLLVSFEAGLKPTTLPRDSLVPAKAGFRGSFENLDASDTPALNTMTVQLARGGRIDSTGLPRCSEHRLRGRTSAEALQACRPALVGEGTVRSAVRFPDGHRLRSNSKLLLFNARGEIIMHVYTTKPLRGTFLVPMKVQRGSGAFGTVLKAKFPRIAAGYGYLTGFEMVIDRSYRRDGVRHGFVEAGCPAPAGFNKVAFELAKVTYRFRNGITVKDGVIANCRVEGT